MIVRNFAAIIFSRLQEKPVRLSTQRYCKIKSSTIFTSKFPLKMISIAFQANPSRFLTERFPVWTLLILVKEIQSNALLMSTFVQLISNQFHVFESSSCLFKFYK